MLNDHEIEGIAVDTYDVRRQALIRAMDAKCEGKQVNLSKKTGIRADYISRMLGAGSSRKRISGDFARKIEERLGLPPLWLDQPENAAVGAMPPADDVALYSIQILEQATQKQSGGNEVLLLSSSELPDVTPEALRFIRMDDLAMDFSRGVQNCVMVVDTSDTTPTDDEVFLINHGNRPRPRRLIFMNDEWLARADNPDRNRYPDIGVGSTEQVFGRIVWAGGRP